MRIYYRGPDASVTNDRFVWHTGSPRTFAIRDLQQINLVRYDHATSLRHSAIVVTAFLTCAAGAGLLTAGPVAGAAIGFLAFLALITSVIAPRMRTVHIWAIQANCRGAATIIYESTDLRMFNQVTRALRRSVEDGRRSPYEQPLAAA